MSSLADLDRRQKAFDIHPIQVDIFRYQVPSQSDMDYYIVDLDERLRWRCECPDFEYRRRDKGEDCKHIYAVKNYLTHDQIILLGQLRLMRM